MPYRKILLQPCPAHATRQWNRAANSFIATRERGRHDPGAGLVSRTTRGSARAHHASCRRRAQRGSSRLSPRQRQVLQVLGDGCLAKKEVESIMVKE